MPTEDCKPAERRTWKRIRASARMRRCPKQYRGSVDSLREKELLSGRVLSLSAQHVDEFLDQESSSDGLSHGDDDEEKEREERYSADMRRTTHPRRVHRSLRFSSRLRSKSDVVEKENANVVNDRNSTNPFSMRSNPFSPRRPFSPGVQRGDSSSDSEAGRRPNLCADTIDVDQTQEKVSPSLTMSRSNYSNLSLDEARVRSWIGHVLADSHGYYDLDNDLLCSIDHYGPFSVCSSWSKNNVSYACFLVFS